MKKLIILLSFFLSCPFIFSTASAQLYSYDFSAMGFSEGQNLEGTTIDSATYTSEMSELHYTGSYGAGLMSDYYGAAGDFYIVFSESVDFLSVTAGDGAGDFDAFGISVYEFGTDSLIGAYTTPQYGGTNEPEWYTLSINLANIGRIVIDPANGGSLPGTYSGAGGVIVTDFSYNTTNSPVPEPTTMLLFGFGLAGLARISTRRK